MIPTITKPTRITRTSATLIDNIIVGKQFHNYEANIGISDISDHLPLILKSHQPKLYKKQPLTITTRDINEKKCGAISTKLQNIDWDNELHSKSANEAYNCFHTKMQEILDTETPIKTIKIKPSKVLKEPWMNPGLLRSIKKQKLLYKKTLTKSVSVSGQIRYKEYRNKLGHILRRVKEEYYKGQCTEYKRNTAKLWKMINKITHNMNDKSSVIEYLTIDNLDIYDTKLITEEFAKYFSSVGTNYANRITNPHTSFIEYLRNIPNNPKSIFMSPTNKTEIERLIEKLPNKKSRGHDDISNLLLKSLKSSISHPLEIILNKSLLEGSFPEMMKQADVTPCISPKRSI